MPTYEYECDKCGKQFEYFQSMKDAPKTECEACGGKLTKLLSAGSGLIFKGSGFYITDYKPKSGVESAKSTADSGGGSKESSSGSAASAAPSPAPKSGGKTD